MNQVYVFNDNVSDAFLSILMNDFSIRDIMFSNIKSTRAIDYNNVLVYVPRVHSDLPIEDFIRNTRDNLFKFKRILVVCACMEDYTTVRKIHTSGYLKTKFKHYCGIAFDTLLSRIVADDCERMLYNFR